MKPKEVVEIIRNQKVVKIVNDYDKLDEYIDPILEELRSRQKRDEGWEEIKGETGGGYGMNVFFNRNTFATDVVAWRGRYEFLDCLGGWVYPWSWLVSKSGVRGQLCKHPFEDKGYWLYLSDRMGNHWDITPEEITKNYIVDWNSINFNGIHPTK